MRRPKDLLFHHAFVSACTGMLIAWLVVARLSNRHYKSLCAFQLRVAPRNGLVNMTVSPDSPAINNFTAEVNVRDPNHRDLLDPDNLRARDCRFSTKRGDGGQWEPTFWFSAPSPLEAVIMNIFIALIFAVHVIFFAWFY